MFMEMTSDETQIQMFRIGQMSRKTRDRDNKQNRVHRLGVVLKGLCTEIHCLAENTWPNHVEKKTSLWDLTKYK